MIAQFLYVRSKDAILQTARQKGSLKYKTLKVLVLLDLPPDILLKRKILKPITDLLKSKNVGFQWNVASDIIVIRDGIQYKAGDIASGRTLLVAFDLLLPPS